MVGPPVVEPYIHPPVVDDSIYTLCDTYNIVISIYTYAS